MIYSIKKPAYDGRLAVCLVRELGISSTDGVLFENWIYQNDVVFKNVNFSPRESGESRDTGEQNLFPKSTSQRQIRVKLKSESFSLWE